MGILYKRLHVMPLIIHFVDLQTIRASVLLSFSLPLMQQSLNYFNVPRSFPKSLEQEISPSRSKSHDDLFIYSRRENLNARIYYKDPGKGHKEIHFTYVS